MLDPQLMFYSNERWLSRSDPLGKYPPYVKEVIERWRTEKP